MLLLQGTTALDHWFHNILTLGDSIPWMDTAVGGNLHGELGKNFIKRVCVLKLIDSL